MSARSLGQGPGTFLTSLDTQVRAACCDSLILSPRGLVRNVPLHWRPRGRLRIGADGNEYDRATACGHFGTGRRRDLDVGRGGDVDGSELSPGEAPVPAVPQRGGEGAETSERRSRLQSRDRHADAAARPGADSGEI